MATSPIQALTSGIHIRLYRASTSHSTEIFSWLPIKSKPSPSPFLTSNSLILIDQSSALTMGTVTEDYDHPPPAAVNFTTSTTFFQSFLRALKETLFPEDPMRALRGQTRAKKIMMILQYYFPILEWGPKYRLSTFRYDLLAGLTIVSLGIPQGISYANLAKIPPILGLYSSFVPPLIYAVFGSSNNLAIGNVAAASLLLASMIQETVKPDEGVLYTQMFITAAFFTGAFQLALGVFRLGIIVEFFSRSIVLGFMEGTAVILSLQQLKGIFGLIEFTKQTSISSVAISIFSQTHAWRWESAVLGIIFLSFLLLCKHLKAKSAAMFWLSAVSPLVVVVSGGIFAYAIDGPKHGIWIVGHLNKGLNPISIGDLRFEKQYIGTCMKAGIITALIALAEGIASGRSLAMMKNEQIDGNKEMIAFGMMNLVGSFTSCFMTTGPFSKSAVNCHAGCKTPMANVVQAICMMLVLLFLAPLFKYTPMVALSTIIIIAMTGLIDYEELKHLYKVDKFDFFICTVTFIGVVFYSMVVGLVAGFGLSIVRALLSVARPVSCKLGRVGESDIYRDIEQYPKSTSYAGIVILKLGSPIFFASSAYLRETILRLIEDEEEISKTKGEDLQYVLVDLSGVTCIDSMGTAMLTEVRNTLERRGIKIALVNPSTAVVEKLISSNVIDLIGKEWVFLTVKDAVEACHFALTESIHKEEHV